MKELLADPLYLGYALLAIGAVCGGSFGLPSKFVKKDTPWEVLWGPFFLFVTIILPVLCGPLLVGQFHGTETIVQDWKAGGMTLIDIYRQTYETSGWLAVALPLLIGILWGFGSMTLGLSFAFIGLSLAYAINYGGQIIVGLLGPMALHSPDAITTTYGYVILGGAGVCLLGIVVCARAGVLKSRDQGDNEGNAEKKKSASILLGLFIAILSGALCACWSIAYSYGGSVVETTTTQITQNVELDSSVIEGKTDTEIAALKAEAVKPLGWKFSIPTTLLILLGGSISACFYCFMQLTRNRTWHKFFSFGAIWAVILALMMAILHDAAVVFFGMGALKLGVLGGSVGYAVFMSLAIITGNINGFWTGEWRGAKGKSIAWILVGILILVVGVGVLGKGLMMQSEATEEPLIEVPVVEEPATDEPVVDEPVTDEAATDEASFVEPATDEPATDEPATDEPATDEPATDEAATDEAATDEAATDEAATDEAATDEAATDEAATDEAATDEAATDEAATDEAATDEAATDEVATDEVATDEVATDEAATDEAATDEAATDEATADEPTVEEPTTDVPTFDNPFADPPTVEEPVEDDAPPIPVFNP